MHITASVFINDAEDGLLHDYDVCWKNSRRMNRRRNTSTTAPAKTTPMRTWSARSWGVKSVVAITNGKLDFGPWEQIFYGEFDGRQHKRALVKIIGE